MAIELYPFTRDIHCSLQQSASHCFSLLSNCYITIYLISGLKWSRSRSRSSVYTGQNSSIQIATMYLDRDLDNFAPCKRGNTYTSVWSLMPNKSLRMKMMIAIASASSCGNALKRQPASRFRRGCFCLNNARTRLHNSPERIKIDWLIN